MTRNMYDSGLALLVKLVLTRLLYHSPLQQDSGEKINKRKTKAKVYTCISKGENNYYLLLVAVGAVMTHTDSTSFKGQKAVS